MSLQDKVHNLQRQLTELIEDAAGCRKNEAVARQQAEAVGAELRSAHDQMATMQRQVVAMQEDAHQQQRGTATEVTLRATKDAEIRKLRHEIDYVRSQVREVNLLTNPSKQPYEHNNICNQPTKLGLDGWLCAVTDGVGGAGRNKN